MKRKGFLLMTLIIFCISCFAGINGFAFSDVEEEHKHFNAITYLTEKNVVNGYGDGTFKPDDTITRAEFLKMALESVQISNVFGDAAVETGFSDVDGKVTTTTTKDADGKEVKTEKVVGQHWAAGYIKLAVDKGIVNGYGDGTFKPDAPVKYEEAIKMIVCTLGRDALAKDKVTKLNLNLWPDAYLSVGNDLMISKSTDYALETDATRANVAQMLYNVKDVKVIVSSNVNIDDGSSKPIVSGGGGSYGGGGGGGYGGPIPPVAPTYPTPGNGGDVTNSTTEVSGLVKYGTVVAAVKQVNGVKKPLIIDDAFERNEVIINNNIVTEVGNNYIILKTEESDVTKKYMQFYTAGSDFSYYLGHRVEMKYRYNPDGGASGRYEIESVKSKETIIKEINAGNIKRDKTIQKNEGEGRRVVWYTDGNEDYELSLGTDDVNNLKVIYNNKVVDTTATPLTIDDFMPESGKIMVVDENTDGSIDLVWIESYETYVVGTKSFNTTPKKITDKFRTDSDGHALVLELDDSGDNVSVRQNGEEIEVTSITQNMILTVAQSKCGLEIDISAQKTSTASIVIASVKTVGGVKKAFNAKSGKVYNFSDYFTKYVDPSLDYEVGDNLTIYLNGSNEVVWATVAEPTYNFGYLISASYNETTEKLNLKILSSGGSVSMFTMADSRTSYITKAINYLDEVGVTPNSVSNPNGYLYKNLNVRHIWESLKENAATINEGKSSAIKLNSATSQPIRYVISSGTEISTLLTLELDTENSFRGESLTYENDANTGRMLFKTDDNSKTFSAETKSMVVFVPNNRDLEAAHYKIGAISSLPTTRKFVEYMKYNIEPYFITDSTGAKQRSVFVVYNESIDAQPTYRSENVIVEKVEETNPSGTLTYVIHGYLKSNTSVNKKYNCYTRSIIERAYVLDENFERTGERRAIETGDVIRIGTTPAGHVANIELIFDASEEFKSSAAKAVAVSNESTLLDSLNPSKNYVFYYARIGEIVNIDSSDTPESCDILIGALGTSNVFIGPTFNTTKVLLFDHTATDLPSTEKNEKFKEIKMEELWGGEILFIWQGAKLQRQQMYAVRYPVVQTQPETPGGDGDENGAEGGANGGEDNTTGEDNNQNGDGTTGDDTTGDGDDTQSGENGSENGGENNPQDLDV